MGIIAGIYAEEELPSLKYKVNEMVKAQAHRGKGQQLFYCNRNMAFSMDNKYNDLSQIEIPKDKNLQSLKCFDGIVAIVDGVVLEYEDFDKDFEVRKNVTSSEIVSLAYRRWGLGFMERLHGEFCCAVWDNQKRRIILARDPYGHKPLHYSVNQGRFVFSSEIKGILASGVNSEIDWTNLSDFLSLNCIPSPGTLFKNIHQVNPGSLVISESGSVNIKSYWTPEISVNNQLSLEESVVELSEAIKRSVKRRMVSKDTYCFLSGGLDSSAVVSFAAEISDSPINAICVGFEDEEENELDSAITMAEHVGAKLHHVIASPDSFFDMLDKMVYHHDGPFTDTSAYPTYYAAKLASKYTDLILTGDGPDQALGGSGHYIFASNNNIFAARNKAFQVLSRLGAKIISSVTKDPIPSLISKIERNLYRKSLSPVGACYDLRSFFPELVKQYICTNEFWREHLSSPPYRHPELWFEEAGVNDDVNRYLYADMKFYIPDDLMIKVDRMCMANSLETMSPFQDKDLGKIVNSLPGSYKLHKDSCNNYETKYILRKICENRLPEKLLGKSKHGFSIPVAKWLRQSGGNCLREILLDQKSLSRGYFRKSAIEKMLNCFMGDAGDYFFPHPNGIVGLLTLELWHRKYID